jgi:hypothetical protein
MGLRSWLTRSSRDEFNALASAVLANPRAHGLRYVIELTKDVPALDAAAGDLIVAWSGDGTGSLIDDMPPRYVAATRLLDDLLRDFPAWHRGRGPAKYGRALTEVDLPITHEAKS